MAGVAPINPKAQFFSPTGAPLANGTVTVYLAGTTTPTNTWQNQSLSTLNTNPIQLDSRGEATVWLDSALTYKFVLANAGGAQQWTVDNISGALSGAAMIAAVGAGLIGFSHASSYSAGTVGAKLKQTVSVKDAPYNATGDGVTDDSAALQAAFTAVANTDTLLLVPAGTFKSTTALSALGVRRLQMDGEIYFSNNTDGLSIGRTTSITNDMARAHLRIRVRGPDALSTTPSIAGTTGVICRGMWRSEVTAHVDGFEYGFEHRMLSGEYVAGCTFNLTLRNSRVKLRFNSASTAFCSDNRYPGLVALKQNETMTPTIGVEWANNTAPSNNNIFDKAWLENNDTPIKFAGECGGNKFFNARLEGAGDIVFTTGGTNGGACNNLVTSDFPGDELSFWPSYTTDSPFPNWVDSATFPNERTLITEITWRDWYHRTTTANRNWMCPKLTAKDSGGFTFGGDYFDWATIDTTARSFTITNFDEGYFDVPVQTGDQFFLGIHHDVSSVASNATIIKLEALDASKVALTTLAAGQLPYIGTTRASPVGHSGTSNTVNIQNDRARQSTGVRVNRSEVKWMRVRLMYSVKFYKVDLFAVHDRYSRPRPDASSVAYLDFKYIDSWSETPDHTGQIGRLRGVEFAAIGIEGKWRGIGYRSGRATLAAGTVTVSLGFTMPSSAYSVLVSGYANETVYVSAKTTTTFTIASSNAASTGQVEYLVIAP